jgi:hypothetical protein
MAKQKPKSSPRAERVVKLKPGEKLPTGKKLRELTGGRVRPGVKDRLPTKADLRESPPAQKGIIPPPLPDVVVRLFSQFGPHWWPKNKEVTIQLDRDVFAWVVAFGRDFQTTINDMLRRAMKTEVGKRYRPKRSSKK